MVKNAHMMECVHGMNASGPSGNYSYILVDDLRNVMRGSWMSVLEVVGEQCDSLLTNST